MKKKMAERMHILPGDPSTVLAPYISEDNIILEHGGDLALDHRGWLEGKGFFDFLLPGEEEEMRGPPHPESAATGLGAAGASEPSPALEATPAGAETGAGSLN